ncbi:tetratricopeptide repeat protein [Yoonia sp. SS1-5]|uniref:Tetratricopeptide repeat protein n=1 Tax=Yoonia rhodophyticola TaxID=3137370 RepID=A0AAN0M7S7_9RHOB
MAKPGSLIASRPDRLGARLIAIANTMRLAATYKIDYKIHWLEKWELTDPAEIFDKQFIKDRFIPSQQFAQRRRDATPFGNIIDDNAGAKKLLDHIANGEDVILDIVFGVYNFASEDPVDIRRQFLSELRSIPFTQPLVKHMAVLRERLSDPAQETVAYHIRRGDLTNDIQAMNRQWPNKFVPDEFFERHIAARRDQRAETILFSDDPKVLERYKASFPDLKLVHDLFDFGALTQAQIDLLELYAMSCCQTIVAAPESAFSQTAQTIGDAKFISVEDDLKPDERVEAFEALCKNLEHRPDTFANEGEIGQCLVHADRYLSETNQKKDIARIMSSYVENGMCLSFVFATLFKRLFETGQYEEIIRLRTYVDQGFVYNLRSFAQVALYHGCALLMLGRRQEALIQISAAFWHEPVEGEINVLCSALMCQGDLTEQNFWFSDPAMTRYMHNAWAHRYLGEYYQVMLDQGILSPPRHLPTTRALVWEWSEFTRAHLNDHYRYKGHFKSLIKGLKNRRWHDHEQDNATSFIALTECRQGHAETASELASTALANQPENPIFHKRMADVYLLQKNPKAAISHLEKSVALNPDARMYAALLGHAKQLNGAFADALAAYQTALAGDRLASPKIYFAAAECCKELNDPEAELSFLERGLQLSPTQWREQIRKAALLRKLDRPMDALDVYRNTHRWADRRPPVTLGLADLLDQLDQPAEAIGILEQAAARYPDKPQFQKRLKKARRAAK